MRRRAGLFLFCGLVLPLVVVANASAQGATLELSPTSGPAGTEVTANGFGFGSNPSVESPKIRLSNRDATVLRAAVVSTQGTFSTTFTIPATTAPGEYLVLATQVSLRGRHTSGPGRAKFRVTSAASSVSAPPGRGTSSTVVAVGGLMVGLIVLAGRTLAVRRLRTPDRPLGS